MSLEEQTVGQLTPKSIVGARPKFLLTCSCEEDLQRGAQTDQQRYLEGAEPIVVFVRKTGASRPAAPRRLRSEHQYAFQLLKSLPCLVLLDLMMPLMDGWQFLSKLQRNAVFAKIPVVLVSALKLDSTNFPSVAGSLRKPVAHEALLATLAPRSNAAETTSGGQY